MNTLLKEWGLKINSNRKIKKVNTKKGRKSISNYIYYLEYINNFNAFI
jgi:hypothetical protein